MTTCLISQIGGHPAETTSSQGCKLAVQIVGRAGCQLRASPGIGGHRDGLVGGW